MSADQTFPDAAAFSTHLHYLHTQRLQRVLSLKGERPVRVGLSKADRAEILRKAGGRCHICGGVIDGSAWEADHVFAHSTGGADCMENYLPAHSLCNNYRWFYGTEEFQWILKLGVWLRTQVEKQTAMGIEAASHFIAHDRHRAKRRRVTRCASAECRAT